jgi:alpha-1,2-mannosyltransferase
MPVATSHASIAARLARLALVLAVVLLVVQIALLAVFWRVMAHELHMNDFGKFYYSARAYLDGRDMYGPTPATAIPVGGGQTKEFWNLNPPHFHLLILPLAMLPPTGALALWFAASAFCLTMSVLLIARELGVQWTPRKALIAAILAIVPSSTGMVVLTGQVTFVLMLPMTLAWIHARRGKWSEAAVYLGLAASVKPFLGIFLVHFLLRRQIRAAVLMTTIGIVAALAGLAVFGPGAYRSWLGVATSVDWLWGPMNGSLGALIARAFGGSVAFVPLVDARDLIPAATVVVSAAVAAFGIWRFSLSPATGEDVAFAGLIMTALLVSPLGWMYYLALLAGPAVALWASRSRPMPVRDLCLAAAGPGLLLPHLVTDNWAHVPWGGATLGSLYTWTFVALWLAVAIDASPAASDRHRLVADRGSGARRRW